MLQFKGQDPVSLELTYRRQPRMMALLCLQAQSVPLLQQQQGSPRSGWRERIVHSCNEVQFTPSVASP